jgi:hypothetical protein
VVVGAVIGWFYDRWADKLGGANTAKVEMVKRLGVLLASGLIVGESLWGVALAGLIVGTNKGEPLALVGDAFQKAAVPIGLVAFAAIAAALYRWIAIQGRKTPV